MPFDSMPEGEPWRPYCRSCKRTIHSHETVQDIRIDPVPGHNLTDLNGPYHDTCARPFLSLAHALRMLVPRL